MTAATSAAASNHRHNGPCIYSSGRLYFYWPFVSDKTLIYVGGVFLAPPTAAAKEGSSFLQSQGGKVLFYIFIYLFFSLSTPFRKAVTRLMPLSSRSDFRGRHLCTLVDKLRKMNTKLLPSKASAAGICHQMRMKRQAIVNRYY